MNTGRAPRPTGFHEGEIAVQELVGVRREAAHLEGMLAAASISRGMDGFLAQRTFTGLTAHDRHGRLWTTALAAPAGFLEVTSAESIRVHTVPRYDDPLAGLVAGQSAALIAMDYERRRRFRINGIVTTTSHHGFEIDVAEAFGNCPQYITPRSIEPLPQILQQGDPVGPVSIDGRLGAGDRASLAATNGFFLGTTHPERGADVSHRGGAPGFVRVDGDRVWWPDYPGNNLFNSLGNLQSDPHAALYLPDFESRRGLHLSGTAELVVAPPRKNAAPDETGRRIVLTIERVAHTQLPITTTGAFR
ncbi:pyridoxamine 5'-phosphate oxidase family protein [Nocardioides ultimimeridianus]